MTKRSVTEHRPDTIEVAGGEHHVKFTVLVSQAQIRRHGLFGSTTAISFAGIIYNITPAYRMIVVLRQANSKRNSLQRLTADGWDKSRGIGMVRCNRFAILRTQLALVALLVLGQLR